MGDIQARTGNGQLVHKVLPYGDRRMCQSMKRVKFSSLLIFLVAVFFGIKSLDGVSAQSIEATAMLGLFSLVISKLNKFKDLEGARIWLKDHRYLGGALVFSYFAIALQLGIYLLNGTLRVAEAATLQIQAILFFTACMSLCFWFKEKILLLLKKSS
jgi:hypothetical protein